MADDSFIAAGSGNLEIVLVLMGVAETFPLVVELVVDVDKDVLVELCVDVVLVVDFDVDGAVELGVNVDMVVDTDVDVCLGVDTAAVFVNGDVEEESGTVAVGGCKVVGSATVKIRHFIFI